MLKDHIRQAGFVVLALAGLVAMAQTPPASKPPKAGEPVFANFVVVTQAVAGGADQKAESGAQGGGRRSPVK